MTSSDKPNTESVPATDESSQTNLQPIDSPDIPEEVLEGLPEDHIPSAREAVGRFVSITEGFSGPIPPPRLLGQYEKLLPGSADRILRMAETE
jgi:hypothetical protein